MMNNLSESLGSHFVNISVVILVEDARSLVPVTCAVGICNFERYLGSDGCKMLGIK